MHYYKITMAKDCNPEGIKGSAGRDVSYITAIDDEAAEQFSIDQAAEFGCRFYKCKWVLFDEIPDDYDKSHIVSIVL